ncbi:MAG: putative DNA binding domain-containing protein [Planctomycetes bacterium]|nr:putative DNA binding domain-containing protein [Planctomycetota bacterium]
MTKFSDDELRALLADLESDLVERKRSAADRSKIRRNICAFANDLHGRGRPGVVIVGAEDDGTPAGLRVDDRLLRELADLRDDGRILPRPSLQIEKRSLDGHDLALVIVHPATQPPLRYEGRVFVKVGPTVRLASPEEEQRLAERRRSRDLPFDSRPAEGASLDDLDLDHVRSHYLPQAIAIDVLEGNRRSLPQQLRSLRLAIGDQPTHGAIIAFGKDPRAFVPGAWVQFVRFDGKAVTDPISSRHELGGRLGDIAGKLDELLSINIATATTVAGSRQELRRPDYPLEALRQLTRNALIHRSYEGTHAPVRVYWYSDRVEIQNPGGLYGQVTNANFGSGVTDYRNPLIAELMVNLGYAQRFGLGIPLALEALSANGNPPPEFRFEPTLSAVRLSPAP